MDEYLIIDYTYDEGNPEHHVVNSNIAQATDTLSLWYWIETAKQESRKIAVYELGKKVLDWS